jgi:hypothetical protein
MVAWLGIRMAFTHDSHRSPSMASSVDQPIRIHSPLYASMGATGRAACGSSSIAEMTVQDDL